MTRTALSPRTLDLLAIGGLVLIAAIPAFRFLGELGFWGDEVWTVWWSQQQGWLGTLRRFLMPPDLPLHFLITKAALLAGENEFAARLPAALSGIATVVLTFLVARRRLGFLTALGGALLLAGAPLHVWYEQEARPYAYLAFLSVLSLALFLRLMERPRRLALIALAVINAMNIYNHLFGAFPMLIELAWGAAVVARRDTQRRQTIAPLAMATLGTALLTMPLWPGVALYLFSQGTESGLPWAFDVAFVNRLLAWFGAGFGLPVFIFGGLAVIGAVAAALRRQSLGMLAMLWIALPFLVLFVVQPAHHFIVRYVLFMLPIFLLLVAHGLVAAATVLATAVGRAFKRPMPVLRFGAVAAGVGVLVALQWPATAGQTMLIRGTDWSGMCSYLRANAQPGDTVIGNTYYQGTMLWCFTQASGVAVPAIGSYSPDELFAAGRPAWYVHIGDVAPDPALARLGYAEVPLSVIEHPGTIHRASAPTSYPYPLSEGPSRLFRGPSVEPRARVRFQEVFGPQIQSGWPNYAQIGFGGRYIVALKLASEGARYLHVGYLAGPGQETEVLVDGARALLLQRLDDGGWTQASALLPPTAGDVVTVEIRALGPAVSAVTEVWLSDSPAG